nr:hypothetical protein [Tanacetum cinerariifolium]
CIIIEERLHTAKTFDLVWIWLGGDYGNVFLTGFNGIQWIETTEEETKILATIYGKLRTVSESFISRNLKLNDEAGLPSFSGRTVPLFSSMLVTMGEGSGTPTEPHHTTSPEAQQTSPTTHSSPSLPPVPTEPLPTVTPSDTPQLRQYTRRARIAYLQRQHIEMASKIEAQELEITNLKARGRSLDEGEEAAKKGSDDTAEMVTVLTSLDAATALSSRVDEVPTGSGSIPTAGPPATGIPTGSGMVPTASLIFTTATETTPYTKRNGKEKIVESDTPKKKKLQEQIDVQVARELEEEMMMIDGLDRNNEIVAKYLQEYHQFAAELPIGRRIELISDLAGWKARHFKGMKLEEIKEKFDPLWKQFQDFIPFGFKEEAERFKRKGLRLEQDSTKKVKTTEEVPEEKLKEMMELIPVEEIYVEALQVKHPIIDWEVHTEGERSYWKIEKELWVELKRLYEPDVEDLLWTHTQNLMHAPVEWKLYDTCGVHYVIYKDQEIFMLVEKDYPFRKGLVIVMISYKLQLENYSQMANDLILKIHKIANYSRQQDD